MAAQAARLTRFLAAAALGLASGAACAAVSVEEAYASANHRRTPFEAAGAIPAESNAALTRLFALTDEGLVLRIEARKGIAVGPRYDALIARLRAEAFPLSIAMARDKIVEALVLHRKVAGSVPGMARAELATTPDIAAASGKLHAAYGLLMRAYPVATARQKQAFFDHLCALDYL